MAEPSWSSRCTRRMAALALGATALLALPARAGEPPPEIPTFRYQYGEPGPHRLRTAAELAATQAIAFGGYLAVNPRASVPGTPDPLPPWDKLALRDHSWAFEADDIRHNYYGHPLAGTLYHLVARGNRLSVLESWLWTTATAMTWELAEYREPVSVSDLVTTSLGGFSIGEALTQLSAQLERSGDGGALAWLAFPKKIHDLVDGAQAGPAVEPGWHELRAFLGAGPLRQADGSSRPAFHASFASRLFRLAEYGAPGSGTTFLADAEQSRLQMSLTGGDRGLVGARFRTQALLWGLYLRDLAGAAGARPRGRDLFAGAFVGFDYQYHDGRLPTPAQAEGRPWVDEMILVEAPGVEVQYRGFAGPLVLDSRVRAAVTFGGVRPLALDRAQPPADVALPTVVSSQGYYHSAGVALGLDLRLGMGPASVSAGMAYNGCRAIQELDGVPDTGRRVEIADARLETGARASYRLPHSGVEVVARWDRRVRRGELGGIAREATDTLLLLGLALVL